MRFFEVHNPYYALLKASSEKEATQIYVDSVADFEDEVESFEIKEVSRDYALVRFSRAPGEEGELQSIKDAVEDFCRPVAEVLVIDGSLI